MKLESGGGSGALPAGALPAAAAHGPPAPRRPGSGRCCRRCPLCPALRGRSPGAGVAVLPPGGAGGRREPGGARGARSPRRERHRQRRHRPERAALRLFLGFCRSSLLFPPTLKVSQGRGSRGASRIPVGAAGGRGNGAKPAGFCSFPWWFCQEKRGLAALSFLCVSGRKKTVKAAGCVLELERFAKNTGRVFFFPQFFLFKLREQCVTVGYPSGFCHNLFYRCLSESFRRRCAPVAPLFCSQQVITELRGATKTVD